MREKKRWDHRENLLLASGKKSRIATALGYVKAYAGNGEKHVYFFFGTGISCAFFDFGGIGNVRFKHVIPSRIVKLADNVQQ